MAKPPGSLDDTGPATEAWIYRLAMEALPDTVFVAGLDGTLQWVCPNVKGIFGNPAEEILATETVGSLLGAKLVAPEGVETETKSNLPATVVDANGVEHSLLVTVKPLAVGLEHRTNGDSANEITGVVESPPNTETGEQVPGALLYACRDITERSRKKSELVESESRFQALFTETLDALVLADDEGRYVDVNPAACELYGLPRTELIGMTVADFAPPEFDVDSAWSAFLDSGEMRGEFELRRPDGESRITDFSARANIRPGEHLSVLRDVTERVEHERQVEAQRDELAHLDHINRLISAVNRALIGANTRSEVLSDVCTRLVDAEVYHYALVATEVAADPFEVTAVAGLSEREAAAVVETLYSELETATDRKTSVVVHPSDGTDDVVGCFPLEYEGTMHGILLIGTSEQDDVPALGTGEQRVLEDLGTTVGKAVAAVSVRQLLNVDETTRLEFVVDDDHDIFNELSRRLNTTVTVTGVVPIRDGRHACYVDVAAEDELDANALTSLVDGIETVENCRLMTDDEAVTLELVVAGGSPALTLETQGAHILTLSSTGGTGQLVVEIPTESNVRSLIRRVRDDFPEARLIRKFTERRPRDQVGVIGGRTPVVQRTEVSDTLTEKQLAALRAAYAGGYYDWPRRGSSAQELAATLGIAPATYHQHLRAAQRKLVDSYFTT